MLGLSMPPRLTVTIFLLTLSTGVMHQAKAQIYRVQEMTTDELRALDRERTVVILPGGILEEHGPHLPSFSDGYMSQRLTQDLANAIVERPGWQVLIFPLIPLGVGGANEIGGKYSFSGTYAVRFATLRAIFMDLATELGEQGFRWIFVPHIHGAPNHNRALDQAGDYFQDTYGGRMVNLFGAVFPIEQDFRTEQEAAEDGLGVHAGMVETSIILYLRPDLVQGYRDATPHTGQNWDELVQISSADGWLGYFGSPRKASAAHGARAWKAWSSEMVELALDMLDGKENRLKPRLGDIMTESDEAALEYEAEVERKQREWLLSKGLQ